MTDTLTTVLGFTKQTIGGNRNTWGNTLNTNFDSVEEAFCGALTLSTTGGTTILTQAQARKRFIVVTGALLSDATIVVPNQWKEWKVFNVTSGDFALLFKTASGTAISTPVSTTTNIFCNGGDGVGRDDYAAVGQMAFFANSAVPEGWFECNGATVSRAGRGIDLFAKIGTTWGVGNGATTFGLPDAYTAGKFLRSRTASVTVGTAQGDQNKAHTHALTAASAASGGAHTHSGTTGTESADHTHSGTSSTDGSHAHNLAGGQVTLSATQNTGSGLWGGGGSGQTLSISIDAGGSHTHSLTTGGVNVTHTHSFTTASGGAHTHTLSGTTDSDGGTEARPTNLSAILCIKY